MEIKIDRNEFYKCISKVQSIIERRSNMPILSTVLLTTADSDISISATDLELGFQQTIKADILEEGSITVSGKKLFEILKESRNETFYIKEKENHKVLISDGKTKFELSCLPADEYPVFIEPEDVTIIEVQGKTLSEMINKTIYSVAIEESGFKLSGVFSEKVSHDGETFIRMVATDGHRLSLIDKSIPNIDSLDLGDGLIIPKKGMSELNKLATESESVLIGFKQKNCIAKKDNILLMIRLLDIKFPDYSPIIPEKEKCSIELDKNILIEALRKMLILSNDRYKAVKITIDNNIMELVSINPEIGEAQENISVHYNSERLAIGFNAKYFIDTLQSMESEIITLGFIDDTKPCIIKGDADKGFLGLIMPMRI